MKSSVQTPSKKSAIVAVVNQTTPAIAPLGKTPKRATAITPALAVKIDTANKQTAAVKTKVVVIDTKINDVSKSTVAYKVFAGIEKQTQALHAWFDTNKDSLFKQTASGVQLDIAGAYKLAFQVSHSKGAESPLKEYPFYKQFTNALQYWCKNVAAITTAKKPSGAVTNKIRAYLDSKVNDAELLGGLTSFICQKIDRSLWESMKASIDSKFNEAQ